MRGRRRISEGHTELIPDRLRLEGHPNSGRGAPGPSGRGGTHRAQTPGETTILHPGQLDGAGPLGVPGKKAGTGPCRCLRWRGLVEGTGDAAPPPPACRGSGSGTRGSDGTGGLPCVWARPCCGTSTGLPVVVRWRPPPRGTGLVPVGRRGPLGGRRRGPFGGCGLGWSCAGWPLGGEGWLRLVGGDGRRFRAEPGWRPGDCSWLRLAAGDGRKRRRDVGPGMLGGGCRTRSMWLATERGGGDQPTGLEQRACPR